MGTVSKFVFGVFVAILFVVFLPFFILVGGVKGIATGIIRCAEVCVEGYRENC